MGVAGSSSHSHQHQDKIGKFVNHGADIAGELQFQNLKDKSTDKESDNSNIHCNPSVVNHNNSQVDQKVEDTYMDSPEDVVIGEVKRKRMGLDHPKSGAQGFASNPSMPIDTSKNISAGSKGTRRSK